MSSKRLRLILGDQLNANHSWFKTKDDSVLYLVAELKQETDYVRHHVQKVCAFFAAMKNFADALDSAGHRVCYLDLDDTERYPDLVSLLGDLIENNQISHFEYQHPDEYRLSQQLKTFCQKLPISSNCVSSEHFFLEPNELSTYFKAGKHNRMEAFYRKMRKRFSILMQGRDPEGGAWNFDSHNRNRLGSSDIKEIPEPLLFSTDASEILNRIERHQVETFGVAKRDIIWPTTRSQARQLLSHFCKYCLPRFGRFQDAMTLNSDHAWSLYHSRLSFALNSKMISPQEVINQALEHYSQHVDEISIEQIEGFVRQILGWREYVRGMYWANMPEYHQQNIFSAEKELPEWFWTGNTSMRCQREAITQSLEHAYAHHIQRLMITGNFALLTGINPTQVDAWYLGIYIDAIEWVELPNTRGMALFADGGWIATKPYAASCNYINKMSDYCSHCEYSVKAKYDDNACPLNSLYWHFIDRHYDSFKHNPRMRFPVKQWSNMDISTKQLIRKRAETLLSNLNNI